MNNIFPYSTRKRNMDLFDIFDDFFSDTRKYSGNLKLDIQDLEKEYIVEIDVPGYEKEEIQVHFENDRLIISAEKSTSDETNDENNYIHRERFCESLSRSVYLKDVDPRNFRATLDNGVLKINAQKQEDKINKYMIEIE